MGNSLGAVQGRMGPAAAGGGHATLRPDASRPVLSYTRVTLRQYGALYIRYIYLLTYGTRSIVTPHIPYTCRAHLQEAWKCSEVADAYRQCATAAFTHSRAAAAAPATAASG